MNNFNLQQNSDKGNRLPQSPAFIVSSPLRNQTYFGHPTLYKIKRSDRVFCGGCNLIFLKFVRADSKGVAFVF